jgi:hypothetical protein
MPKCKMGVATPKGPFNPNSAATCVATLRPSPTVDKLIDVSRAASHNFRMELHLFATQYLKAACMRDR